MSNHQNVVSQEGTQWFNSNKHLPSSRNGLTTPTWRSRLWSSTNPQPSASSSSSTWSSPLPSLLLSSSFLPVTVVTLVHCFLRRFLEKLSISWANECMTAVDYCRNQLQICKAKTKAAGLLQWTRMTHHVDCNTNINFNLTPYTHFIF